MTNIKENFRFRFRFRLAWTDLKTLFCNLQVDSPGSDVIVAIIDNDSIKLDGIFVQHFGISC